MNWIILLSLIAGSLATPIQQEGRQFREETRKSDGTVVGRYGYQEPSGNLRVVKYSTGRDGLMNSGIEAVPQYGVDGAPRPIIWNPEQPIIVEPAPLTYGVKGGQLLTERDVQRHMTSEEEMEVRDEGVEEEPKPLVEPKPDSEVKDQTDLRVEEPKPMLRDQVGQLSKVGNKQAQVMTSENEQVFPQVVSGQRRLVEPQLAQQYAVKGRSLRPIIATPQRTQVFYQTVQHGLPIAIEEHRVSPQGVRRPVIQYQLSPIQQQQQVQQQVPREWVRRPTYQVMSQMGTKSVARPQVQYQYVLQPVIPTNLIQRAQQLQGITDTQGLTQDHKYVRLQPSPVLDQRADVDQRVVVQHDSAQVGVHDVDHRPLHVVQEMPKTEGLVQKHQTKTPVSQQAGEQVVEIRQQELTRHVPVVSGQRVIGYQMVDSQQQVVPQQQRVLVQQPISGQHNQQIQQHIPVSDIQQYYQIMQQIPIQSYGQQNVQYIPYIQQNPIQTQQPLQYSGEQTHMIENEPQPQQGGQDINMRGQIDPMQGYQGFYGIQGYQQIQPQEDQSINRGQDLRVTQLMAERPTQQRTTVLTHNSGVKSAIHV